MTATGELLRAPGVVSLVLTGISSGVVYLALPRGRTGGDLKALKTQRKSALLPAEYYHPLLPLAITLAHGPIA